MITLPRNNIFTVSIWGTNGQIKIINKIISIQASNYEFFRGHGFSPQKGYPKILKERIQLGIIFFRLRNKRTTTGIFLISLLSGLMMIISRSYRQKKGIFVLLKQGQGSRHPQDSLRSCVHGISLPQWVPWLHDFQRILSPPLKYKIRILQLTSTV